MFSIAGGSNGGSHSENQCDEGKYDRLVGKFRLKQLQRRARFGQSLLFSTRKQGRLCLQVEQRSRSTGNTLGFLQLFIRVGSAPSSD